MHTGTTCMGVHTCMSLCVVMMRGSGRQTAAGRVLVWRSWVQSSSTRAAAGAAGASSAATHAPAHGLLCGVLLMLTDVAWETAQGWR